MCSTVQHCIEAFRFVRVSALRNAARNPRRWLLGANPKLSELLTEAAGPESLDNAELLINASPKTNDANFIKHFSAIKLENKVVLANYVQRHMEIKLNPTAMFDVQIKRIHEYKRQLLNILETIDLYLKIKAEPNRDWAD